MKLLEMRCLFITLLLFVAQSQAENVVKVPTLGTLSTFLTQAQKDTCTQLTVQGKLNSADIRVLRKMAGADNGRGVLKELDLQHAKIVKDSKPYLSLNIKENRIEAFVCWAGTDGSNTEHSTNYARSLHDVENIYYDTKYRTPEEYWWSEPNRKYEFTTYLSDKYDNETITHSPLDFSTKWIGPSDSADWEHLSNTNAKEGVGYMLRKENGQIVYRALTAKI